MSLEDIIASYIDQQRSLGKRYLAEANILTAFRRSVGDVPVRDIRSEMISRFVDRDGTGHEARNRKHRVLSGLFFFAVTRRLLRASPTPRRPRKRACSSSVPYIYSEAELSGFSQRFRQRRRVHSMQSMPIRFVHFFCFYTVLGCAAARRGVSR